MGRQPGTDTWSIRERWEAQEDGQPCCSLGHGFSQSKTLPVTVQYQGRQTGDSERVVFLIATVSISSFLPATSADLQCPSLSSPSLLSPSPASFSSLLLLLHHREATDLPNYSCERKGEWRGRYDHPLTLRLPAQPVAPRLLPVSTSGSSASHAALLPTLLTCTCMITVFQVPASSRTSDLLLDLPGLHCHTLPRPVRRDSE
jgi:hypothetical protein